MALKFHNFLQKNEKKYICKLISNTQKSNKKRNQIGLIQIHHPNLRTLEELPKSSPNSSKKTKRKKVD